MWLLRLVKDDEQEMVVGAGATEAAYCGNLPLTLYSMLPPCSVMEIWMAYGCAVVGDT